MPAFDLTLNVGHQCIVVDPIKETSPDRASHISDNLPPHGRGQFRWFDERFYLDENRNCRVEDRCELLQQGLLDQAVHDAGNAQLPGSTFWAWEFRRRIHLVGYSPASNRVLRGSQYCFM
ncbi:hypothetical protein EY04_27925 [Pseudomonas chlororaphis]|nr:hypothetical protein EY04_27925 [Pseudomonas chlororaphis]